MNISADGRRPVARANRKYDSPSDVALNGDVWPLVGQGLVMSYRNRRGRLEKTHPLKMRRARGSSVAIRELVGKKDGVRD